MLLAQPNFGRNSLQPGAQEGVDFTTFKGPGDDALPQNEISGYSLVSRIGEVVVNAVVDTTEWSQLREQARAEDLLLNPSTPSTFIEARPAYAEWASTLPGMICLARKHRTDTWRRNLATESAVPVISCAACLGVYETNDYFFAGVCRSKSIMPPDDGVGPQVDEFFTLAVGGMFTLLNTSGDRLSPGDYICWTLEPISQPGIHPAKKARLGPRRVGITKCHSSFDPNVVGKVMTFAKVGEPFDCLLKQ